MTAPTYVHRVLFACVQARCGRPAVSKVVYSSGSFYTVCDACAQMLVHTMGPLVAKLQPLADGEGVPDGFDPVSVAIPVEGHPGFTTRKLVGAVPRKEKQP